jgi:hypothetical protein
LGFFALIGWIIRILVTNRRQLKLAQIQAEMQTRLLDKFSSAEELQSYLDTEAGQRFLHTAAAEEPASPYRRILGSVQAGLILTAAGIAFLSLQTALTDTHEAFGMMFLGALALALGIGFLISSFIAYRLSKSWGLINGNGKQGS